ncbi:rh blood group, D antigen isoform X2 [Triplophysa dalaica]|uniref:rh blood group, D antigen isoform X2 n=1 Tax=Triplophysa dalaica TaxID=1582913 RepID=UPI0024DF6668|nr:rh blood group, D antigen isoform X2 [Triplophysa dalaica]
MLTQLPFSRQTPPCPFHVTSVLCMRTHSSLAGEDCRHSEFVTVTMAPQYAPSLRSRLPIVTLLLEIIFLLLFVFFVKIEHQDQVYREFDRKTFILLYAEFQDVHVMIFLGFGFLATFLVRYGFSGSGFNMLVAAMAIQWSVLMNGFLLPQRHHNREIYINMKSVIEAELCAASALIAMGAVHGKLNPVQLLLMALLEVTGFVVNQWILQTLLRADLLYSIMLLHIFGGFFGVMASWVLHRDRIKPKHEKEKTDRRTGLFSMLGTLFLWIFWPSFNAAVVYQKWDRGLKLSVIYGTYLSLAVSVVVAMTVSMLTSSKGKMNMVHVQGSVLSGGVAIGVAMTAVHTPWIAMTIGLCAALLSSLGFRYMKGHMLLAFECHDTCGVLNVHAIPGILGWLAHLFLRVASTERTIALEFAVHHICVLFITLCMSLVRGMATGLFLKLSIWRPQQDRKCFDDQAFWKFPNLVVEK